MRLQAISKMLREAKKRQGPLSSGRLGEHDAKDNDSYSQKVHCYSLLRHS